MSSSPPSSPKIVRLAHRQNSPSTPSSISTLFLHGLDSSSHTWRDILTNLNSPGVAVDLRTCGLSPSGDVNDFSADALVEDVKCFVNQHEYLHGKSSSSDAGEKVEHHRRPFVLVGHSLGGRLAALYASKYPEDVAALVIEDMDMKKRSVNPIPLDMEKVNTFHRGGGCGGGGDGTTKEDIMKSLVECGYPSNRIEKWASEGRIRLIQKEEEEEEKQWWSDVNPQFRFLCYKHIFDTDSGEEAWDNIVASSFTSSKFPCHVMVASAEHTVCDEGNIKDMRNKMMYKGGGSERIKVHHYPSAYHSIHNSAQEEFMEDLKSIIDKAQARE